MIDTLRIVFKLEGARTWAWLVFQNLKGGRLTDLSHLQLLRGYHDVTLLLFVLRRAVPVEVEASEDDPPLMESIVLKPLLVHETIESNRTMLFLRWIICWYLFGIVVLLSRALVLNNARAFFLGEGSLLLYWVKKFNDSVQIYILLLFWAFNLMIWRKSSKISW